MGVQALAKILSPKVGAGDASCLTEMLLSGVEILRPGNWSRGSTVGDGLGSACLNKHVSPCLQLPASQSLQVTPKNICERVRRWVANGMLDF